MTTKRLTHHGERGALMGMFLLSAATALTPATAATIVYDDFDKPNYSLTDYAAKWSNPYGLLEMDNGNDTRSFAAGNFAITAAPFKVGADFSVFDHLKYLAVSKDFAVPTAGEVTFSTTINTTVTGVEEGRIINGTYIESGLPYAEKTHIAQQAAAVMNMIDFSTGQLFDIFISGGQAMTLIERLPSSVTGSPDFVGIDKMYTQIIDVVDVGTGPHDVAITYSDSGSVLYYIDGVLISKVDNVGIPLDKQGKPYSGVYPSYGPGELLAGKIKNLSLGTGLFSLLDAFPFQHPDRPDLAVSVPIANRLFGQGISATFDNVTVTTNNQTLLPGAVPEPASWSMMIAGLGIVGAAMRRRVAKASFA